MVGNRMVDDTLQVTGTVRGVFFSLGTTPSNDPRFDCAKAIIDLLNQAKKTVHIAIYSLTESHIADAIIEAHNRGVEIAIVTDATQSKNMNQAAIIKKLAQAGVDIRLTIRQKFLMHNKIAIFDGNTVCTGSFNWTTNAEKHNDENLVVLDGSDIASDYENYVFQRILQNETFPRNR